MKPLSLDTTTRRPIEHFHMWRSVPAWRRLALAFSLTNATRQLILANLEHRFPGAGQKEIRRRFIARFLLREDVIRAFGFDPVKEG